MPEPYTTCGCGLDLPNEEAAGKHAKVCPLLGMPRGRKHERGKP